MRKKPQTTKTKCEPVQNLWKKYPPPWTVTIEGKDGVLRDFAGDRICIFDAERDGAYHIGLAAAIDLAAIAEPPQASLKGFRYYRLGDVITDLQKNIDALPPDTSNAALVVMPKSRPLKKKRVAPPPKGPTDETD